MKDKYYNLFLSMFMLSNQDGNKKNFQIKENFNLNKEFHISFSVKEVYWLFIDWLRAIIIGDKTVLKT